MQQQADTILPASIARRDFNALPAHEQRAIDIDVNNWIWDDQREAYMNRLHPDNEQWRMDRETLEAQAWLGSPFAARVK